MATEALSLRARQAGLRSRALYLPSLLLAAVTAGLVGSGADILVRSGRVGPTLLSGQNELAGPVVIGLVLGIVVCEHRFPAVRRPLLARGQLHDGCYLIFFVVVTVPFVTLLGVGVGSFVTRSAPWLALRATASLPGWLVIGVALVLMDGCNWLTHLGDHRLLPLWRVHAVHHSQEELSVLTTFRAHPLVHTTGTLVSTVPVVALTGYHPVIPELITGYLVLGALPHANVRWSFGPLGRIFVSPAYHRLHHRIDGPQDVNLGIVLSVFDELAGRAVFPQRGAALCDTGLTGRPLAVEQGDRKYHPVQLLAAQLLEPFTTPGPY